MAKSSPHAPASPGANPYPPVEFAGHATLTANSAAVLRDQIKFMDAERSRLVSQRSEMARQIETYRAEIDGIDTVLAEMDGTADRYRQRLATAPPPLVPADPLSSGPGDARSHAAVWNGAEVPQTGVFSPVPPLGELDGSKAEAMDGFLGSHAAIGQDGTR